MKETPQTKNAEAPSFQGYFYANLYFWGVLVLAGIVGFFACGAVWDDVTQGAMEFLFVIVGGGFTMVSVLDFLYEVKIAAASKDAVKDR